MIDEWDEFLGNVEKKFGEAVASRLSDMIDEGLIEETELLVKWLNG